MTYSSFQQHTTSLDHFNFFPSLYSPLLMGEQKNYIQQFAAESFSFLMRKIKDSSKLFDILFSTLDTQPGLCQGLGFLCFEMIKGVKQQFHSMTDSVLPILFSKTGDFQSKSVGVAHSLQWELVCTLYNYVPDTSMPLWIKKQYMQYLPLCITTCIIKGLTILHWGNMINTINIGNVSLHMSPISCKRLYYCQRFLYINRFNCTHTCACKFIPIIFYH